MKVVMNLVFTSYLDFLKPVLLAFYLMVLVKGKEVCT